MKPVKLPKSFLSYGSYFDVRKLKEKLARTAKKAGVKVTYAVLLLYYVATDRNTPLADKAKIYGALGYFILPLDAIPDAIPMMGYSDDLTALLWALRAVWSNITPEIRERARQRLASWFGEVSPDDLNLI